VTGHPELGVGYRGTLLGIARDQLATAAAAATAEAPGIDVEQQLVVGSPIAVLGDEARRAQLLVLGDRGLGRLEGLLIGSVAAALAAHAPCPIVVVRGAERDPSEAASLPVVVGDDGSATSDAAPSRSRSRPPLPGGCRWSPCTAGGSRRSTRRCRP
jgi:Universal stress protein family